MLRYGGYLASFIAGYVCGGIAARLYLWRVDRWQRH